MGPENKFNPNDFTLFLGDTPIARGEIQLAEITVPADTPKPETILISSAASFIMAYGACSYYDESKQLVTAQTSRLMHSYIDHNPERRILQLDARPLPIPDKVDSWLVATVC